MFRLFDPLVEGRLLGGVSPRAFPDIDGAELGGPSVTPTIDLARGGGAAEAGRIGPLENLEGFPSPNSDLYGGAVIGGTVACRKGGGGGNDGLVSTAGSFRLIHLLSSLS